MYKIVILQSKWDQSSALSVIESGGSVVKTSESWWIARVFGTDLSLRVTEIGLDSPSVTLASKSEIHAFRHLKSVSIVGASYTNKDLNTLTSIASLESVVLQGTSVSRKGMTAFSKERPDVRLHMASKWIVPEMEKLHPCAVDRNWDPIEVIRLVNKLRELGKRPALAALETFFKRGKGGNRNLHLFVPLLFERANPTDPWPTPSKWEASNVVLFEDIPFNDYSRRTRDQLGPWGSSSGEYLLSWAKSFGALRQRPLHPPRNPLRAAERLAVEIVDEPNFRRRYGILTRKTVRGLLQDQAIALLSHLGVPRYKRIQKYHEWIQSQKVRWNATKQAYVKGR